MSLRIKCGMMGGMGGVEILEENYMVTWCRAELRRSPLPTVPHPDTTAGEPPYDIPACSSCLYFRIFLVAIATLEIVSELVIHSVSHNFQYHPWRHKS